MFANSSSPKDTDTLQLLVEEVGGQSETTQGCDYVAVSVAPEGLIFLQEKRKKEHRQICHFGTTVALAMVCGRGKRIKRKRPKNVTRNVLDMVIVNTSGKPQLLAALSVDRRASIVVN